MDVQRYEKNTEFTKLAFLFFYISHFSFLSAEKAAEMKSLTTQFNQEEEPM